MQRLIPILHLWCHARERALGKRSASRPMTMSRISLSLFLIACFFPAVTSSQTPRDTSVIRDSVGLSVMSDSAAALHRPASARPMPMSPVAVPKHGRRICRSDRQGACALYGALLGAGIGMVVGQFTSPAPVYEHTAGLNNLFGSDVCTANCGTSAKAWRFGIVGAGFGGIVGWVLGRN